MLITFPGTPSYRPDTAKKKPPKQMIVCTTASDALFTIMLIFVKRPAATAQRTPSAHMVTCMIVWTAPDISNQLKVNAPVMREKETTKVIPAHTLHQSARSTMHLGGTGVFTSCWALIVMRFQLEGAMSDDANGRGLNGCSTGLGQGFSQVGSPHCYVMAQSSKSHSRRCL